MILCNLESLIADKKTSILEVSNDTGISRTTLTALKNNSFQGIQLETINTLCKYFAIGIERLLIFTKYDFEFSCSLSPLLATITIDVAFSGMSRSCELDADIHLKKAGDKLIIEAEVFEATMIQPTSEDSAEILPLFETTIDNNRFIKRVFSELDPIFKAYIRFKIQESIICSLREKYCDDIKVYDMFIDFPEELS